MAQRFGTVIKLLPRAPHPLGPRPLAARGARRSLRAGSRHLQAADEDVLAGHAVRQGARDRRRRRHDRRVGCHRRVHPRALRERPAGAAIGSPLRGEFLQWVRYAEATAFPPLGIIVWHTLFRGDADQVPGVVASARERAEAAVDVVERALKGKTYLLGADFSAADIMMGFTLAAARILGVLDEQFPNLTAYLSHLEARPAFRLAAEA